MPVFDSNLTTVLIIISVSFILLLIGVVVTYFWLVRKYLKLQEEQTKKRIEESQKASKIIEDARVQAQKILSEANDRARIIISNSEDFRKKQDKNITQALEQANQLYLQSYKEMLKDVQMQSLEVFQNISEDVKSEMANEMGEFREYLHGELSNLSEGAREEIGKIYEKAETEAQNYKKTRMRMVDESIMDIVKTVTMDLIGKELSIRDHQELVMEALETAKKQKMFVVDDVGSKVAKSNDTQNQKKAGDENKTQTSDSNSKKTGNPQDNKSQVEKSTNQVDSG